MQVILQGNYLGSKQGKSKNGEPYYIASVLSGDTSVRVSFDSETLDNFQQLRALNRLDDVAILCELQIYNGNAYLHALPY